jgi:hypothetical protein
MRILGGSGGTGLRRGLRLRRGCGGRAGGTLLLALLILPPAAGEDSPSAFRLRKDPAVKATVDLEEVREGTPAKEPRDAIPAIRRPEAVKAADASWLADEDRVLGIEVAGEARAYPLRILEGHEVVDDTVGGVPVAPNY